MAQGRTTEEILAAARAIVEEQGIDRFTMQALAARAGVSKTSIYKRWRTKEQILIDLLWQNGGRNMRLEDTGSTAGDLRLLVKEMERTIRSTNAVVTSMVGSLAASERLIAALRTATAEFHESIAPVFHRGIDRGDLDPDTDVQLATLLAIGPFSYLIEHRLPVPEDLAERIADRLTFAFASRAAQK